MADGYMLRHRNEWERTLMFVNTQLKKPLSYDEIFGGGTTKNEVRSKEDWEKFKSRFKSLKENTDG